MSDTIIIGVDHGYTAMKIVHFVLERFAAQPRRTE